MLGLRRGGPSAARQALRARSQEAGEGPGGGEGCVGRRSTTRAAKEQVEHPQYAYRDRKAKKRNFRRLWIIRSTPRRAPRGFRTTSSSRAAARLGSSSTARCSPSSRSTTLRRSARSPSRQRPPGQLSDELEQVFHQAEQCATGSPLYADLCRRLATEPAVREVLDDALGLAVAASRRPPLPGPQRRSRPVGRSLAGATAAAGLRRFVQTQGVQTNEVQRSWLLLPASSTSPAGPASRPSMLEIGPSAGLNLVWDRYRYRYEQGTWGSDDVKLELSGEERRPIPPQLLRLAPRVRQRRDRPGARRDPARRRAPAQVLRLGRPAPASRPSRPQRCRRCAPTPELERGNAVERLPQLLAERLPGALTVVFQTAVRGYLSQEDWKQLLMAVDEAGRKFRLPCSRSADPVRTLLGPLAPGLAGRREAAARARRLPRPVAGMVGLITSAANPRLKLVRRLASRRQRERLGLFV